MTDFQIWIWTTCLREIASMNLNIRSDPSSEKTQPWKSQNLWISSKCTTTWTRAKTFGQALGNHNMWDHNNCKSYQWTSGKIRWSWNTVMSLQNTKKISLITQCHQRFKNPIFNKCIGLTNIYLSYTLEKYPRPKWLTVFLREKMTTSIELT